VCNLLIVDNKSWIRDLSTAPPNHFISTTQECCVACTLSGRLLSLDHDAYGCIQRVVKLARTSCTHLTSERRQQVAGRMNGSMGRLTYAAVDATASGRNKRQIARKKRRRRRRHCTLQHNYTSSSSSSSDNLNHVTTFHFNFLYSGNFFLRKKLRYIARRQKKDKMILAIYVTEWRQWASNTMVSASNQSI